MAKGFKDDNGKFHPTERELIKPVKQDKEMKKLEEQFSKEVSEKRASELKELKGRIKETRVFKFDDLESDVQEKVLESERTKVAEFSDTFFAEDQGLIFDDDEKKDADDIGLSNPSSPKYFDVGSNRGTDFVQYELEVKDEDKFAKYLGIGKELLNKIEFRFENDNNRDMSNTTLEIVPPRSTSGFDSTITSQSAMDDLFRFNDPNFDDEERLSAQELETLIDAVSKFDSLMHMTLVHLSNNYEDQFTDERIKEDLEANEREFEADGTPA